MRSVFPAKVLALALIAILCYSTFYGLGAFMDRRYDKDDVHDLSMAGEDFGTLSGQELIDATLAAEKRAARATYLRDLIPEDENDFFVVNTLNRAKDYDHTLRLRCWGKNSFSDAHTSGGTFWLGGQYEAFHTIITPLMEEGHSLTLVICTNGQERFRKVLTAETPRFSLDVNVRGASNFSIEISTSCYGSQNPGILMKNPYFN